MKKELGLEELEKVTGGVGKTKCRLFVQALKESYVNQCENCRFYNKNNKGVYTCTHPSKDKSAKQSGLI